MVSLLVLICLNCTVIYTFCYFLIMIALYREVGFRHWSGFSATITTLFLYHDVPSLHISKYRVYFFRWYVDSWNLHVKRNRASERLNYCRPTRVHPSNKETESWPLNYPKKYTQWSVHNGARLLSIVNNVFVCLYLTVRYPTLMSSSSDSMSSFLYVLCKVEMFIH